MIEASSWFLCPASPSGDEEEVGEGPRPRAGQSWSILGCLSGFWMKIKVFLLKPRNLVQTFKRPKYILLSPVPTRSIRKGAELVHIWENGADLTVYLLRTTGKTRPTSGRGYLRPEAPPPRGPRGVGVGVRVWISAVVTQSRPGSLGCFLLCTLVWGFVQICRNTLNRCERVVEPQAKPRL